MSLTKYAIPPQILLDMGGWRQPLMMVDAIDDFKYGESGFIRVIKHVTWNEPWIAGHFPNDPIMPGALISEVFGQASEYYSFLTDICNIYQDQKNIELRNLRDIYGKLQESSLRDIIRDQRAKVRGVLASQNLKFKDIARPGDTIEVVSKLSFADEQGFKHYFVSAQVGKRVISQGMIINFREQTE